MADSRLTHDIPHDDAVPIEALSKNQWVMYRSREGLLLVGIEVLEKDVNIRIKVELFDSIVSREILEFGNHPFKCNVGKLQRIISFVIIVIITGRCPAPSNVAMVPHKKDLLDVVRVTWVLLILYEEGGLELQPTLVQRHSMANV